MTKINRRKLDDGSPVYSFSTLMAELSTLVRNTCRVLPGKTDAPDFEVHTPPRLRNTAPSISSKTLVRTQTPNSTAKPCQSRKIRPAGGGASV
jgi:hypothetical protein